MSPALRARSPDGPWLFALLVPLLIAVVVAELSDGGMDAKGIAFEGVDEALRVPQSDLRLFGKPEAFTRRRMGVALANGADTTEARARAKLAASKVRPVKA